MRTRELAIEGMSCGHCVMHVKKELGNLQDVVVDDVQIGKARIRYDDDKVSMTDLAQAIERAGYKMVP